MLRKIVVLGTVQNYLTGWVLHYIYLPSRPADNYRAAAAIGNHGGHGPPTETHQLNPFLHFLRDSTLALPVSIGVLLIASYAVRSIARRADWAPRSARVLIGYAVAAAVAAGIASVPEVLAHGWLFDEHVAGVSMAAHLTGIALVTTRSTFALILVAVVLFGVPWRAALHNTQPVPPPQPVGVPAEAHGEA